MSARNPRLREATFEAELAKHRGLMWRWAEQVSRTWPLADIEEMINVGAASMWVSWGYFKEEWGVKFITYAERGVRRKMLNYLATITTIRVPMQQCFADWKVKVPRVASLDKEHASNFDGGDGFALQDYLEVDVPRPDDLCGLRDDVAAMHAEIEALPPKIGQAVTLVYLREMTQAEAGQIIGVTHQRVQQLATEGLVMLRHRMRRMIDERKEAA